MSWLSDSTELVSGGWLSSAYEGHGVRGDQVPASGTHGAALLFQHVALPSEAANEFRWVPTATPGSGTFALYEDSSATLTGAPDGSYAVTGQWYKDGVLGGTSNNTIVIGTTALGALLTVSASIFGGSASGGGATVAQGALLTATLSMSGGAASGGAAAPVSFAGTVPTISTSVGASFTYNFAPFFSGALTPYTYTLASGALPSGITLVGSQFVGTATVVQSLSGLSVTATDTGTNTATTNSFAFNVDAVVIPVRQISQIPTINLRAGVPFSYDLSPHFQTTRPPLTFSVTQGATLPRGLALVGSVLSGTPQESERHLNVPLQITVSDAG